MLRSHRWILLLACGLMPSVAYASDFTGIGTFMLGLPGLLGGILMAAGFFAFPASGRQKVLAGVLFAPLLSAALWIFSIDTFALMRRGHTDGVLLGAVFVLMLVLLVGLVARILLRPLAPEDAGGKPVD